MIKRDDGYIVHPHFGGNWNNSAKCGSRRSNWNNSPLTLNSNNSSRGVTDTGEESNSLADSSSLSEKAKYAATDREGLVEVFRTPVPVLSYA
jgi:hypothetical protein